MKKGGIFLLTFLLLFGGLLFSQEKRGLKVLVKELGQNYKAGKQYLLLIAIDKYVVWPPLKNPVKDAQELKDILTSKYYIDEVIELYDEKATKANIIKIFENLQKMLQVNDSLLVIYSGHGHLDKTTNSGFWIPVNAGLDKYEQSNWLPNTQIRGLISNIKSIHLLIISDSCFSGDLLNSTRTMPDEINNEYFSRAYARISRQIVTSGASEAVPDESEFTRMLKMALLKNSSPYFDPFMLFNEIRLGVKGSMPMFGNLKDTGHQDGASFLLFLREEEEKEVVKKEEPKKEEAKKATVEPVTTKGEFLDEFNGATLNSKWRWKRETPSKWSLKERPGFLTIKTENGDLYEKANTNRNLLLTDVDYSDFMIETKLEFNPTKNWQQAGLIIYKDDDNYLRFTFGYWDAKRIQIGNETKGKFKAITNIYNSDILYLRLVKNGNNYSGFYSEDGRNFILFGEFTNNLEAKLKVGIIAFNGEPSYASIMAYFDYFRISDLSTAAKTTTEEKQTFETLFTLLTEYEGHKYYISKQTATWHEAKEICEKSGGHLVTITSAKENEEIIASLEVNRIYDDLWIGFTNEGGSWLWITGEKSRFNFWSMSEPNNSGGFEHWAHIWKGHGYKWNDSWKDLNIYFILEID